MVVHGLVFTSSAGSFKTEDLCNMVAKGLSGPNWVAKCEAPKIKLGGEVILGGGGEGGDVVLSPEAPPKLGHAQDEGSGSSSSPLGSEPDGIGPSNQGLVPFERWKCDPTSGVCKKVD